MSRYRGTVVSQRSAEDTFDYLADFSNAAEWDPGVADAERLDVRARRPRLHLPARCPDRHPGHAARLPGGGLRPASPGSPPGRERHHPLGGHGHRGPEAGRRLDPHLRRRPGAAGLTVPLQPAAPAALPSDRRPWSRRSPSSAVGPTGPGAHGPAPRSHRGRTRWTRRWRAQWWAASHPSDRRCGVARGLVRPPVHGGQGGAGDRGHLGARAGHGASVWPGSGPPVDSWPATPNGRREAEPPWSRPFRAPTSTSCWPI